MAVAARIHPQCHQGKNEMRKLYFLSNHADLEPLRRIAAAEYRLPPEQIEVIRIPHPLLKGAWDTADVARECRAIINLCVDPGCEDHERPADLILNGDYCLVSLIVIERLAAAAAHPGWIGRTGFLAMDKLSDQDGAKRRPDGSIEHRSVLIPVRIRWLPHGGNVFVPVPWRREGEP